MRYVIVCFLASVSIVILLLAISIFNGSNKGLRTNGFRRSFIGQKILNQKMTLFLIHNSYYIAGVEGHNIYLGNYSQPNRLLMYNIITSDTQRIRLDIPHNKRRLAWKSIKISIDSANLFVAEGITPMILKKPLLGNRYENFDSDIRFNDFQPINSNSFVCRSYDVNSQNLLVKDYKNSKGARRKSYYLERQVDGFFCTDGILLFNHKKDQIFYVYFYRNQFICLDTSLSVLYKGKTIDSISHANIKIGNISSQNKRVLLSSQSVNKHAFTDGDFMFIHSDLIADNERVDLFDRNSVIDVYSLDRHAYLHSFYLPNYNNKAIREFRVVEDLVVVMYDRYLSVYDFSGKSPLVEK